MGDESKFHKSEPSPIEKTGPEKESGTPGSSSLKNNEPTRIGEIARKWPKVTFCIICNEFCERFSFYGMRAVLTLYVINVLSFSQENATILFHAFIVLCYSSPLLGSILADGYIGKFWTIFWLSLFYAGGQIILSIASTLNASSPLHPFLDLLGLVVIGIGSGCIKPCVSAFGGDQFNPHHTTMISIFFSIFYFSINAGSTISMFITPIFRTIPCGGRDNCYPLAFGVPAALMIIATVVFMAGSRCYKKCPPKENAIFRVISVIYGALQNKARSEISRDHWLEHHLDSHQCEADPKCVLRMKNKSSENACAQKAFVEDVKALLRVVVMMLPIPMYWALYDQQGSKWIVQAVSMNSRILPSFSLLPDQMQTVNAVLILIFIPIFQFLIYPAVQKLGIQTTPLRRMVSGGVLASLAFIICALVQIKVNHTLPNIPKSDTAFVSFVNLYDKCSVTVRSAGLPDKVIAFNDSLVDEKAGSGKDIYRIHVGYSNSVSFEATTDASCGSSVKQFNMSLRGGQSYYGILTSNRFAYNYAKLAKPTSGQEESFANVNLMVPCSALPKEVQWGKCAKRDPTAVYTDGIALCRRDSVCNPNKPASFVSWSASDSEIRSDAAFYSFKDVDLGTYDVYYMGVDSSKASRTIPIEGVTVTIDDMGAMYTFTLMSNVQFLNQSQAWTVNRHTLVPANSVSILWQLPQYVVLTAAEILIAITGIEFAYSQAPPSLKSVVQAIWCLTTAAGDIIIIIIELLALFHNLAIEMMLYAAIMLATIFIFALLSIFYYEYVDFSGSETDATDGVPSA